MDEATEILPLLYLGPLAIARDCATLQHLGISAVVCAAAEGRPYFPDMCEYFELLQPPIEHTCGIHDLVVDLDAIWTFVAKQFAQNHKVLVHCVHGRTRSASIVAYILAKQQQQQNNNNSNILQAYEMITSKRDVFIPEEWLEALQKKFDEAQRPVDHWRPSCIYCNLNFSQFQLD